MSVAISCLFIAFKIPIKDTSYVYGRKQQNLQLLDIRTCNSVNKASFKTDVTFWMSMHFLQLETIVKKVFVGSKKDGILTEISTKISRSC